MEGSSVGNQRKVLDTLAERSDRIKRAMVLGNLDSRYVPRELSIFSEMSGN